MTRGQRLNRAVHRVCLNIDFWIDAACVACSVHNGHA
jgi:hypothetical protein